MGHVHPNLYAEQNNKTSLRIFNSNSREEQN